MRKSKSGEATAFLNNVESFQTWPPQDVDPWRVLSSLEHDCLLVVEFSEVIGPRPVLCVPHIPGPHFHAGDFAVWLMTADYQMNSSSNGPLPMSKDIQLVSYNEEQGVHTYAHHFSLHDIEARGFVRPFCVAFLAKDSATITNSFSYLRNRLSTLVDRLKLCNRRVFLKQLAQAIDTLGSVENQAISSYYELYYDNNRPGGSSVTRDPTKTEKLNVKTRKMGRDLLETYRKMEVQLSTEDQCTGPHSVEIDGWFTRTVSDISASEDEALKPLVLLAPCAFHDFEKSLRHLWARLRREKPLYHLIQETPSRSGLQVNLDGFPLLSLPRKGSTVSSLSSSTVSSFREEEEEEEGGVGGGFREPEFSQQKTEGVADSERVLLSLFPSLPHLLFPVLTGQFLLVCGSEMRSGAAQMLIQRLRKFLPSKSTSSSALYRTWHQGRVPATAFADFRLFGLSLPQHGKLEEFVGHNVIPFISVIDFNSDTLCTSRFKARLLESLGGKSAKNFRSDKALVPHLYTILSDYGMLAYVLYYLVYSTPEMYRKNSRYLAHFASKLGIQSGDLRIVRYLVEVLKTQQVDATHMEGAFENLFLEHEPSIRLKL